jgi:glutamate synthase domain-containing protein 3
LKDSISKHARYTQSKKAAEVLANWEAMVPKFVKVMPRDYKRVLQISVNYDLNVKLNSSVYNCCMAPIYCDECRFADCNTI